MRHLFLARGRLQAGLHRLYHPAQPRIDYEVTAKEFLGQMVQLVPCHLNWGEYLLVGCPSYAVVEVSIQVPIETRHISLIPKVHVDHLLRQPQSLQQLPGLLEPGHLLVPHRPIRRLHHRSIIWLPA